MPMAPSVPCAHSPDAISESKAWLARGLEQANKVDVIYALSQAWCTSNQDADFDILEKYLQNLKPEEMILVRAASVDINSARRGGSISSDAVTWGLALVAGGQFLLAYAQPAQPV